MLQHIPTALYSLYVAPEDGLDSPKHVEHPKIKTSYKNLCILLVHLHIICYDFNRSLLLPLLNGRICSSYSFVYRT